MSMGLLVGISGIWCRYATTSRPKHAVRARGRISPKIHMRCASVSAHHLIPLAPLARSDGDFAGAERNVIIEHCAVAAGLDAERRTVPDR